MQNQNRNIAQEFTKCDQDQDIFLERKKLALQNENDLEMKRQQIEPKRTTDQEFNASFGNGEDLQNTELRIPTLLENQKCAVKNRR